MDFTIIIFLLVIASVVMKALNQKKAEEAKRQAQQRQNQQAMEAERAAQAELSRQAQQRRPGTMQPTVQPTVGVNNFPGGPAGWACTCGNRNPSGANYCRRCGRARAANRASTATNAANMAAMGSMAYASTEGAGSMGSLGGASGEGMGGTGSLGGSAPQGPARRKGDPIKSTLRHAVQPVTESGHGHVESSITGVEGPCAEDYTDAHSEDAYALSTAGHELPFGMKLDERDSVIQGMLYAEILGKPKALRK